MDEKLIAVMEVEKDGQKFVFQMPYGFKFGAAYDAAHEIMLQLVKRSHEFAQQAARKEEAAAEPQAKKE